MRCRSLTYPILLLVLLALALALVVALTMVHLHVAPSHGMGASITPASGPTTSVGSVNWARLVILVDNNPGGRDLVAAWGVSMYVETPAGNVLFDTGPDPSTLEHNAEVLGVDPCNVTAVVISHEHLDHTGGLRYIASHCPQVPVYVPRGISSSVLERIRGLGLRRVILVNETTPIMPGVAVLRPLYGPPWEQALLVNITGKGLIVLVGCSHPGVVNIVEEALEETGTRVYMVVGGLHMFAVPESKCKETLRRLVGLGVEKIAPIHCSGDTIRKLAAELYPDHYLELHVGSIVTVKAG